MKKYAVDGLDGYPNELAHKLDDALEQNAELLEALKDSRDLVVTVFANMEADWMQQTLAKTFDIMSEALTKAEGE